MSLQTELEWVREEIRRVVDLPEAKLTHQAGRDLGISDLVLEEVFLMLEEREE